MHKTRSPWHTALLCATVLATMDAQSATRLFTAPRKTPFRRVDPTPGTATVGKAAFTGTARPGEFYVFQVGMAPDTDTEPLSVRFSDLRGKGTDVIPSSALRCISLRGIGNGGEPFAKSVSVRGGTVQVLWFGIDTPRSVAGTYCGNIDLCGGAETLGRVAVELKVEGKPVEDHGDSAARNLSRLRWLDSTVGNEPTLTAPFVPIEAGSRTIRVLGRELALGNNGLPASITSFFNAANTRVLDSGRPVLAGPFAFVVQAKNGQQAWTSRFGKLEHDDLEARWTASSRADGLETGVEGRLDYTGSGEVSITLRATRDLSLDDIRLEIPWSEAAATYFMGLHRRGGRRPAEPVSWTWDVKKRQDCFWMGDVNAGMMVRFKDEAFVRPLVNIYYHFNPLKLPKSWGNEGRGGIGIGAAANGVVPVRAFSGPRELKAGETLTFVTELYLTPFRPLDTEKQWAVRFVHLGTHNVQHIRDTITKMDPATEANVLNIHHANAATPFINYPYADDSVDDFASLVDAGHEKGMKVKVYYTTREITQNMPELHALHSMNGEIIFPGPGKAARTLIHKNGPHPWLIQNLGTNFIPAWVDHIRRPGAEWDLSVITTPDSRWNNFYLEGLRWMCDKIDIDGVYIDDTALDARSLRRARRILDRRPGRLIDFHTWNHFNGHAGYANNLTIYMELLPYLDRLWIGEGFHCDRVPWDYWLVEMSGLPFGLMGEMLQSPNPWRGLVFGQVRRWGWSGNPKAIWKAWDEYGIQGTEFMPFTVPDSPVQTGRDDVLASIYRKKGRTLVALASWEPKPCDVALSADWEALGLDPTRATLYAPPIDGFQQEALWKPGEPIEVDPGRGYFLVLDEIPRKVVTPADVAASLVEVWNERFTTPVLDDSWKVAGSSKLKTEIKVVANALRITAPANLHAGIERALPAKVRAVEVELDPGTDGGQNWGPGIGLVWENGRGVKMNLRLIDMNYEVFGGDGSRQVGGGVKRGQPVIVRILLDDARVHFQVKAGKKWKGLQTQSRNGLAGDPVAVKLGKMTSHASWQDFGGTAGPVGESAYRNLRVLALP